MKLFGLFGKKKSHDEWLEKNPGKDTLRRLPGSTPEDLQRSREVMEKDIQEQKDRRNAQ